MTFGIICLAAGVLLVLLGGWKSARRVKRAHGNVNSYSVRMSEGTGVVPRWASHVVLTLFRVPSLVCTMMPASASRSSRPMRGALGTRYQPTPGH